jgi:GntR family transcriptional repressor for pyruvate dehydrogenase complex
MARDSNPKTRSGSFVRRAAQALRQEVLGRPDGAFLGSEVELVRRLNVSRPTFRQAAKLLEQEQLLRIRRGVGGGFFARRPTVQAVTHVASVYLLARKATMAHAIEAARPLFAETARLGAMRADPMSKARITEFLQRQEAAGPGQFETHSFLKAEREFLELFAALSGNPVLQLYTEVLVDFAGSYVGESVYAGHPERVPRYCATRKELLESILGGDEQVAQLIALRRSDMIVGWLQEDLSRGSGRPSSRNGKRSRSTGHKLIGLSTEGAAAETSTRPVKPEAGA